MLDLFDTVPRHMPELKGISHWINSEPLTLEQLKGKVVLVDFWTYSCINCLRTQPYLNAWYDKYKDDGLVIIGVHTPEFAFEKGVENVERAVKDAKIKYPVAQDNEYATWNAFDNHYWPAKYLIDKEGMVTYTHFGEGDYDEIEERIQLLLGKSGDRAQVDDNGMRAQAGQTAETYLGYERGRNFVNRDEFQADKIADYTVLDVDDGSWSLGGKWLIGPESSTVQADEAVLRMGFSAREVYLVMDGPKDAVITMKIDGKAVTNTINGGADVGAGGRLRLDGARLYRLVRLPVFTRDVTLDITFPKGVSVNAFTFGG